MGVRAVLQAWDTWLGSQAAPISTPVRFQHAQPWPYEGTYPFVVLLPHTQRRTRYSNAEVYLAGFYRLMYADAVAPASNTPSSLLLAASDWHEAVAAALQSSEINRSLGGAVDYVGEGADGEGGLVFAYDEKISAVDAENRLVWGVPLDVWVRCLPEPG